MKRSVILAVVVRLCSWPIWIYSVYLLFVGHNTAGGGFIAGLVALAAVALQMMAFGPAQASRVLPLSGPTLIAAGLGVAAMTGLGSFIPGYPFLTSAILQADLPLVGPLAISTASLFDVGVYIVVLGAGASILSLFGDASYE